MKSTTIIVACLLACALPFIIHSCKKDEGGNYRIQTAKCPHPGIAIMFGVTFISGTPVKQVEWDFGDGSKSSDIAPSHVYQSPGSYNVTVVVNKKQSVHKMVEITAPVRSDKTAGIAGVWLMTGLANGTILEWNGYNEVGVLNMVDSPFSAIVVNEGQIQFMSRTLYCQGVDTVSKTLYYSDCSEAGLTYYYDADSIEYKMHWQVQKKHGEIDVHGTRP